MGGSDTPSRKHTSAESDGWNSRIRTSFLTKGRSGNWKLGDGGKSTAIGIKDVKMYGCMAGRKEERRKGGDG